MVDKKTTLIPNQLLVKPEFILRDVIKVEMLAEVGKFWIKSGPN